MVQNGPFLGNKKMRLLAQDDMDYLYQPGRTRRLFRHLKPFRPDELVHPVRAALDRVAR
jgi:hypothetical protein